MRITVSAASIHPILLTALLTAGFSACSVQAHAGSSKADAYKAAAEGVISEQISKKGFGPLTPTCALPAANRTNDGDVFICTATTADGRVITFDATIESDGVEVVPTNVLTTTTLRNVEKSAADAISKNVGRPIKATDLSCGNDFIVYVPGDPIACTLTDPDGRFELPAVVTLDSIGPNAKLRVKVGEQVSEPSA
jgi:hypothetical protein